MEEEETRRFAEAIREEVGGHGSWQGFLEGSVDVDAISPTIAVLGQASSPPWPLPVATSLALTPVTGMASSHTPGMLLTVTLAERLQLRPHVTLDPWAIVRIKHGMLQRDAIRQSACCIDEMSYCAAEGTRVMCPTYNRTLGAQAVEEDRSGQGATRH